MTTPATTSTTAITPAPMPAFAQDAGPAPARQYVELRAIRKKYKKDGDEVPVLHGVDLAIARGERVAIMGRSGSGKSTLLNILGCLDAPSEGQYLLDGNDVSQLDDKALSQLRNQSFGFVFQAFHLLPGLSILDNVKLPLEYRRTPRDVDSAADRKSGDERAVELLELVGLAHRMHHRPNELSGGERQRSAIARALVNAPRMLLADEPTGALDSRSQGAIMDLFAQIHARFGATLVVVTHDPSVAKGMAGRTVHMLDGRIVEETRS